MKVSAEEVAHLLATAARSHERDYTAADNAAARDDLAGQRCNLDHIALMESGPKPWEPKQRA